MFSFPRSGFSNFWAEAVVILGLVTDIEIVSDFKFRPVDNQSELINEVLAEKQECIDDSRKMFEASIYGSFLDQFGENCKDLPHDILDKVAFAREQADP